MPPLCFSPSNSCSQIAHAHPLQAARVPLLQIPSAAANPKGPYLDKELTAHRPSLQSEYQNLALEAALDAALADARLRSSKRTQEQQQEHK